MIVLAMKIVNEMQYANTKPYRFELNAKRLVLYFPFGKSSMKMKIIT